MTKYAKQLNTLLIVFITIITTLIVAFNSTQASILNRFLVTVNGDSNNQNLSSMSLSSDKQLCVNTLLDVKNLSVTRNSLVISPSLSFTSKPYINNESKITKELTVTTTAYSSTPDQTDDDPFTMANGHRVHDGAIAANFLPFGTRVMIPELYGDKVFTVEDRMNK